MSKFTAAVLAAVFAMVTVTPVALADAHAQSEKKPNPVAAACKDKKPGDMVKVDGKDVKCPAPKAAPAK